MERSGAERWFVLLFNENSDCSMSLHGITGADSLGEPIWDNGDGGDLEHASRFLPTFGGELKKSQELDDYNRNLGSFQCNVELTIGCFQTTPGAFKSPRKEYGKHRSAPSLTLHEQSRPGCLLR